jgi:hypothetical protein
LLSNPKKPVGSLGGIACRATALQICTSCLKFAEDIALLSSLSVPARSLDFIPRYTCALGVNLAKPSLCVSIAFFRSLA